MSANLEIQYRGYAISFSENQEVWRCWALDLEGEKLATVKTKIDRIIAAARKLDNPLPVIRVDYHMNAVPVRIISLAQPRKDRLGVEKEPSHAWCIVEREEAYWDAPTGKRAHRTVEGREKIDLSQLYVDNDVTRSAMAQAATLKAEIDRLTKAREAVLKGMQLVGTSVFKIADVAEENTDAQ